jgi:hypothetical protein
MFHTNLYRRSQHSCSIFYFNLAAYKIICKNSVDTDSPQMTIWRTRTACWTSKATNTRSEYASLIAFPLQQCLHERAPVFLYTYSTVHCLSCFLLRCPCTECKGSGLETRPRHDQYADTRVPISITLAYSTETARPLTDYAMENRASILGWSIIFPISTMCAPPTEPHI